MGYQSPNFDTFKCSGENLPNFSCLFSNHWSVFLQNLHNSLVSSKITPLYFCSSNNIYFGHKEPIKKFFLDFLSAQVKFCNWGSCYFQNDKSVPHQFLYHSSLSWHNSTVNLKLIHFLLWAKGSYQSSNFDTFECSGENLQNSSCHFSSNKSVFLQILHHSLVSWKITSLYFFSSNNIYFAQKESIKMKILGLSSSAQVKICQIFYVNFETTSWFLSKFCISLQFNEWLFLCIFLAQTMHTLLKRSPLKWKCLRLSSARVKFC